MGQRFESWDEQVKKAKAAGSDPPDPEPSSEAGRGQKAGPAWLTIAISASLASIVTFGICWATQSRGSSPAAAGEPVNLAEPRTAELRDERLIRHFKNVAENAINSLGMSLIDPMWLKSTYTVEWKSTRWVVEGIVLEKPEAPIAYFWAVEISPIDEPGPETFPPKCRIPFVVFNLAVWKGEDDGTFTRLLPDRTVERGAYRKLSYD